jgi:hypothetical protein
MSNLASWQIQEAATVAEVAQGNLDSALFELREDFVESARVEDLQTTCRLRQIGRNG